MAIQDKPDFVTIRLLLDCVSCKRYPMNPKLIISTQVLKNVKTRCWKLQKKALTSINHTLTCLEDQMKDKMENEDKEEVKYEYLCSTRRVSQSSLNTETPPQRIKLYSSENDSLIFLTVYCRHSLNWNNLLSTITNYHIQFQSDFVTMGLLLDSCFCKRCPTDSVKQDFSIRSRQKVKARWLSFTFFPSSFIFLPMGHVHSTYIGLYYIASRNKSLILKVILKKVNNLNYTQIFKNPK